MDSSFVRERIPPGHRFVGLHRHADDFAQHLAGSEKLPAFNTTLVRITIAAYAHGHDNLFERRVARTFANAINGALYLASSGGHGSHGIGHRHAEIVVAVG